MYHKLFKSQEKNKINLVILTIHYDDDGSADDELLGRRLVWLKNIG